MVARTSPAQRLDDEHPTKRDLSELARTVPGLNRQLDVLVVEDEPEARAVLVSVIRRLGHQCRVAADGDVACALLKEKPADVVISDWQMPRMTGAELCRRIRSMENGGWYTYFILISAFHDREHLIEGMAAGADDYQRKPIDLDEVEARLVSAGRVVDLHKRLAAREQKLRRDSSKFWRASRTDSLTGLGNRLNMQEELASALACARRYEHAYSLAIMDVDHFKSFNDTFGHLAGDDALKRVAQILRDGLRTGDNVFRYGGEELLLLLPEQSLLDAHRAVDRLRMAIANAGMPGGDAAASSILTASAGVAQLDLETDRTVEDWIARADSALYTAKIQGRNRVSIAPTPPPGP